MASQSMSALPKPKGELKPKVYQFLVTLLGFIPRIYRQIRVPSDCGFFQFHSAIMDYMGWDGIRLYWFEHFSKKPEVKYIGLPLHNGVPSYEHDDLITDYFTGVGQAASYVYDDQWRFHIELEKIMDPLAGVTYPMCLNGEQRVPREGTTNPSDYRLRLRIAADPYHPEHSRCVRDLALMGHSLQFNPMIFEFVEPTVRFRLASERLLR